jgi:hypothetical protein
MIKDYQEGAKVIITPDCIQKMIDSHKSINHYPSDSYIKVAQDVVGLEGTVTRRFKPGFEFNVEWPVPYKREDGTMQDVTILQVKDHWVEPLDNNWKEVK